MTSETKRLAVIPARGGSKRIPRKNIRTFCGKPMMAHVIETAARSGLFNTIHISTDDDEIAAVAEGLGFPPTFRRPTDLADDNTGLIPVLRHVAETYYSGGQTFDQAWLLMPCAPLLTVDDIISIDRTCATALEGSAVVCAVKAYGCIERSYRLDACGMLRSVDQSAQPVRSQDLPESYFDAGVCSVFPPGELRQSTGPVWEKGIMGHVLPKRSAVDIDTEDDWAFAELLYRATRALT